MVCPIGLGLGGVGTTVVVPPSISIFLHDVVISTVKTAKMVRNFFMVIVLSGIFESVMG
jgi:hypothetical protein